MHFKIYKVSHRSLKLDDVARIMLGTEPFHSYGFTSKKACKNILKNPSKANLLVAKSKGQVLGFAFYNTNFLNGYYLRLIAVDPNSRGLGVGKKLMETLEKKTFKNRSVLYLCVTDFNRRAQRFYKERGFEKVGVLKNYVKKGINEIFMRKVK